MSQPASVSNSMYCFLPTELEGFAPLAAVGRQVVDWRHSLEQNWSQLQFGDVKIETRGEQHILEVQVYHHDLDPKAVRVELYAPGVNGNAPVRQEMKRDRPMEGALGGHVYTAAVSAVRPAADYTARVLPHHEGVAVPLEDTRVLWQR